MKKVLLTAMALLTIASTSVFGMYGSDSGWIDFLVHGNQLRARMNQFGFVLGNDMIRGTFGFKSEIGANYVNSPFGSIFQGTTVKPHDSTDSKQFLNFIPTLSAGIGYTSDIFSIGVGYNYRYMHDTLRNGMTKNGYGLSVHTPVVTMTAMNDSLRIAIPVQIAAKNGDITNISDKSKYMGISMDPQIRYYTGLEAFTELRLYIKYGMNQYTAQNGTKSTGSSVGFDFRAYFGATVGDVALSPFIKVTYDTALNAKGKQMSDLYNDPSYTAAYGISSYSTIVFVDNANGYEHNPWKLEVLPTLGMSANSDIVSIYVEGALGYRAIDSGRKFDKATGNYGTKHDMRWNAYGEVYITPVKDLEWYFEAEIGNGTDNYTDAKGVQFNTSTGITWYLPALCLHFLLLFLFL